MLVKQLWLGCGENGFPCRLSTLRCSPRSRRGPAMGSNYHLDASWQPNSIASAISPRPQAFSRQIASSTLKSNLLPATGFYQRNASLCSPGQCTGKKVDAEAHNNSLFRFCKCSTQTPPSSFIRHVRERKLYNSLVLMTDFRGFKVSTGQIFSVYNCIKTTCWAPPGGSFRQEISPRG